MSRGNGNGIPNNLCVGRKYISFSMKTPTYDYAYVMVSHLMFFAALIDQNSEFTRVCHMCTSFAYYGIDYHSVLEQIYIKGQSLNPKGRISARFEIFYGGIFFTL